MISGIFEDIKKTVFITVYPDPHAHMQQEEGVTGKLARF